MIVGLERERRLGVGHEAHVGLVDPHAEGVGGDDDGKVVGLKPVLQAPALTGREPGVKGGGADAAAGDGGRQLLGAASRGRVHHGGARGATRQGEQAR